MRIAIGYPPLEEVKGIPFLAQNRQFQWGKVPWTAYPIVPAYAATMLKKAGHEVAWLDGIAKKQTFREWLTDFERAKADLLVLESKTPVIKRHWRIINRLKSQISNLKIVLVGDHVTALPEESFENSEVDYVLTGGDYDFLLLNLVEHLSKGKKLEPGIWQRKEEPNGEYRVENTGKFHLDHNLDRLPFVDRDLTGWDLYAHENSNYSRLPGTYTMFARDCWWGKCTFCSWTTLYPGKAYRSMSAKRALDEVGYILENYPVKEIMDDSGTFPIGDWLKEFCQGMIKRGYSQKVKIDCNMRFNNSLREEDYGLMARAGFRFLLFGLESANQETLDKLNKNLRGEQIIKSLKMAKSSRLWPHITVMIGYPWEGEKEVVKTVEFVKNIFSQGLVDTLQATIVIPYPGTPLFEQCQKNGWLKTLDWDRYDMTGPVMKTSIADERLLSLVRDLYSSFWTPSFLLKKGCESIVDKDKFRYYAFLGRRYLAKLFQFR